MTLEMRRTQRRHTASPSRSAAFAGVVWQGVRHRTQMASAVSSLYRTSSATSGLMVGSVA